VKWYIRDNCLCFNAVPPYVYELTVYDLRSKPVNQWVKFLKTKMWFVDERGFRMKYYELIGG
jgi:hypothetical protein